MAKSIPKKYKIAKVVKKDDKSPLRYYSTDYAKVLEEKFSEVNGHAAPPQTEMYSSEYLSSFFDSAKEKGDYTIITSSEGKKAFDKVLEEAFTKEQDKDITDFNREVTEQDKLPIDKLIEIADKAGLLKEQTKEEKWVEFIQGIRLHDILNDCLQSSMQQFVEEYNKLNPIENIGLKLHVRKRKSANTRIIFGVSLVLEMRRHNTYKTVVEKHIDFTHIRQLKDEKSWRYSLYGSMFNAIVGMGLTLILAQDDINTGRTK